MAWPTEAGCLLRAQAAPKGEQRGQKVRSKILRTMIKPPEPPSGSLHPRGRRLGFNKNRRRKHRVASGVRQNFAKITLSTYYVDVRENYRIFNPAVYRFYKSTIGPPLETDTPFATNVTLPFSPADTFGNGVHYLSVSNFNGVLDSGFLPIGANGETYLRLDVGAGVQTNNPPDAPLDVRLILRPGGVIRIQAIYAQLGALRASEWAITYTTNGSTPGTPPAVSPTVTQSISGTTVSILEYDLPAQADGTTVKVRLQVRRNDVGTWVYSGNSSVLSAVADAVGPTSSEGAGVWRGKAPQEL